MRTLGLPLLALTVLVNVLVSREGLTVFARLGYLGPLGQVNLTVEAARLRAAGRGASGDRAARRRARRARAWTPTNCCASLGACIPARRWPPPSPPGSCPVLSRDAAAPGRGAALPSATAGRAALRERLGILRAVIAGSLDRSLDVAATLEVRGYGSGRRPARARAAALPPRHPLRARRRSPRWRSRLGTRAGAVASFQVYPLLRAPLDAAARARRARAARPRARAVPRPPGIAL